MARAYLTSAGDRCASKYERDIVQECIDRGLAYEYEPLKLEYETAVVRGACTSCGATGGNVVQRRTYTPDLLLPNGIIVEVKGKFDASKRNLMRQLVRCNPDRDIRFVFMRDNKFGGAKTRKTYTDWARLAGVQAAVVEVNRTTKRIKTEQFASVAEWWNEPAA